MFFDEFPQGNAHLLLNGAGQVHMAGNTEQLGPRVLGPPQRCEPAGPAAQNLRRHGDGFHIGHGGGATVKTDIGRKRGPHARLALIAFETLQQGRFLAANVGARPVVKVNLEIPSRFTGVSADQASLASLVNGRLKAQGLGMEFPPDVDVSGIDSHGETGEQRPLHQFVGVMADDFAVLAGAGLTLVGIDNEVMGPPVRFLRHEGPFHASGEARAAASAQTGFLDLFDNPVPPLAEKRPGAIPVATLAGAAQTPVGKSVEIGKDAI